MKVIKFLVALILGIIAFWMLMFTLGLMTVDVNIS